MGGDILHTIRWFLGLFRLRWAEWSWFFLDLLYDRAVFLVSVAIYDFISMAFARALTTNFELNGELIACSIKSETDRLSQFDICGHAELKKYVWFVVSVELWGPNCQNSQLQRVLWRKWAIWRRFFRSFFYCYAINCFISLWDVWFTWKLSDFVKLCWWFVMICVFDYRA